MTSKIHAVTDGNGKAMNFIITEGSVHDSKMAKELLEPFIHQDSSVLGDKTFDTDEIIEYIVSKVAVVVIPPKKNCVFQREYDKRTLQKS